MTTTKDILVVTTDAAFLAGLRAELSAAGFEARSQGGLAGLSEALRDRLPTLLVLDLDVSEEPAWDVLGGLRQDPHTRRLPVVAVSERCRNSREVITGLRMGAVEYVLKPCDFRVLAARIGAILKAVERRRLAHVEETALQSADGRLVVDLAAHRCTVRTANHAQELALSPKEFELLGLLLAHKNNLVRKDELLRGLWPAELSTKENVAALAQFIAHLRRKLGPLKSRLKTVWGLGYRFDDQ